MLSRNVAWLAVSVVLLPAALLCAADDVNVTIKEWDTPSPNTHPHDTEIEIDGSLWYTGQYANVLGRLDPASGKFTEFQLKTPHSGPHGLQEDNDGNMWYTGNTGSLMGKLDPKTGAVTEYKTPEPGDPHTLMFDKSGILWFTMQNANRIGRLDPKSGEIKLLTPPTPKSRPYGMAINSKGTVFGIASDSLYQMTSRIGEMP